MAGATTYSGESKLAKIGVLLVDGDALVREGVRTVLEREPDIAVLGETTDPVVAFREPVEPDVIIAEPLVAGDRTDGVELVRRCCWRYPESQVLILTRMDSIEDVQLFMEVGAAGYILKKGSAEGLVQAVRCVALGQEYLQPSLGAALLRGPKQASRSSLVGLTQREKEVLRVLALGHTNIETAAILSYAVRTIEGYRARIMRKLNVRTRAELVRAAAELDLLHFDVG